MSFESDLDKIIGSQKYGLIQDERIAARLDLTDRAFGNMLQKLVAMRNIAVRAAAADMTAEERVVCQSKVEALQRDIEAISDIINRALEQGRVLAEDALEESIAAVDDSYAELLSIMESIERAEPDNLPGKSLENSKINDWIKKWSN